MLLEQKIEEYYERIFEGLLEEEKQVLKEFLPNYLRIKNSGKTNTGRKTAVLVSNVDGEGNPSEIENFENLLIVHFLFQNYNGEKEVFFDATSDDLKKVVQNTGFESIYLIGHSTYSSWVASDREVTWKDLILMLNGHLKKGKFVVIGCGEYDFESKTPLGYFIVSNPERQLFGYEDKTILAYEVYKGYKNPERLKTMPTYHKVLKELLRI